MPNFVDLFFSFRGRISRKSWWIGFIIMLAANLITGLITAPQDSAAGVGTALVPAWIGTFLHFVFVVPETALAVKRFNDRDWPYWLGYVYGAASVGEVAGVEFNFFHEHMETPKLTLLIAFLFFVLFTFIDNGFMRGTKGPNRYGPDPLKAHGTTQ